jgi:hypothetical protein
MAKKKTPPPEPTGKTPDHELPWLDPSTDNTRICKCGAVNWGRLPACRKCS